MATPPFPQRLEQLLLQTRRAHLATADAHGEPHVVPVVFVYVGGDLYIPIDAKPKSVAQGRLKRIRNLRQNPRAALLVDHYDEDWSRLGFLLIHAAAEIASLADCSPAVGEALRRKYPPYHHPPMLAAEALVVRLRPRRYHAWGAFAQPEEREGLA